MRRNRLGLKVSKGDNRTGPAWPFEIFWKFRGVNMEPVRYDTFGWVDFYRGMSCADSIEVVRMP